MKQRNVASNLPRGSPTLPCFLRARSSCCPPLSSFFSPSQWRLGNRRGEGQICHSQSQTSLQPTACAVACSVAEGACLPLMGSGEGGRRGEKGGGGLLLSALALHSNFPNPVPRSRTVYRALRECERVGGEGWPVVVSAEHAVRPWVEIDAKRVLILRRTRVDPVSAIVSPALRAPH